MLNNVILIGRIVKDLEIKHTQSNIAYVKFTLAVNRAYTTEGQEQQADFINVTAWRNQAENLYKFMGKGSLIGIEGRIETGSYEKDGSRVYTTEVVANRIAFLESKKQEEQDAGYERQDEPVYPEATKTNNPF